MYRRDAMGRKRAYTEAPPITNDSAAGGAAVAALVAEAPAVATLAAVAPAVVASNASSRECTIAQPGILREGSRVRTMLMRPASGFPMDRNVAWPMMTGRPIVSRLKRGRSPGI